jgi:predicted metal-dependent phosphoesterase TrpH
MKIQCKLSAVLCLILALAMASVAQTGAVAAPAPLSAAEREAALNSLQTTHDAFLKSIAGLSEKQWRFKPAAERWSVAEVAEHITISESTIFGMVESKIMTSPATPEKRAEAAGKDETVLKMVADRTHKAQAPEFLKPSNRWATREELTKAFEGSRKTTMDYVRTTNDDLRDHIGPHPMLGPLDAYQWILLISAHSERHTKQIEEVKADPKFPKE